MHLRLRTQILLVALLPTLLAGLLIGGYLLATRVADLRDSQTILGEAIVSHLAPASEFAVLSRNRSALERLTTRLAEEATVREVRILDPDGQILAEAISESDGDRTEGWMHALFPVDPSSLRFEADIRIADDPVGDFEGLFSETGSPVDSVIGHVEVRLSSAPLMQRQAEVLKFGILLILVGLLLAFAVATRAGLNIVNPINRVVQAFRDFGQGNLDRRVPVRSRGETALLEQGFNDLATEIQMARERMEAQIDQATSELRETLEAVEIQNVELDLARKRAEESNRIKSEFLANISHEIRTPMNAIFGYTQLLARTRTDQAQGNYIQTIQRSAESLLALLEDVLNLSRIEAGRVEVDNTALDPEELLEETLTIMAPNAHDKDLELIWHPRSALPPRVIGDRVKLRQILSNLLSNACKFTDQGSVTVEAAVRSDDSGQQLLQLAVSDTGIGISESDQMHLFQAFSQLDSSSARRHQGAGLGLVICDQLTRLMGGRIEVDSEPGRGSRFWVEIPVQLDAGGEPRPVEPRRIQMLAVHKRLQAAVSARLENLGCDVDNIQLPEDPASWAGVFQGMARDIDTPALVLDRQLLNRSDKLDRLRQSLATSPHPVESWLILVSSQDRQELLSLEDRLGTACLPVTSSSQGLRDSLHNLACDHQPSRFDKHGEPIASQHHRLDGVKIMVVEDNRINRHLTLEFLHSAQAETRAAEDGYEALKIAAEWKADVVLMDIQLPGMDGLDTSRKLRSDHDYDDIPILALTASASEEEHRRCLDAGLDGVMVKPIRAETMIERIRRAMEAFAAREVRASKATSKPASVEGDGQPKPVMDKPSPAAPQPMGRNADGQLRPDIAAMVEKDLSSQMEAARRHHAAGELEKLDAEVHTMKGTAAFCGFATLQAACEAIRASLHASEGPDSTALKRELETVAMAVDEVLSEIGANKG